MPSRWGSKAERHRLGVAHLLACRYEYYVLGHTKVSDAQYDDLEEKVRGMGLTCDALDLPGSDIEESYTAQIQQYHHYMTKRVMTGEAQKLLEGTRLAMITIKLRKAQP